jgi:YVTN family beta-propeller protein
MNYSHWVLLVPIGLAAMFVSSGTRPAGNPSSQAVLLVANKGDRTLGIVDPEGNKQIATVAEDGTTGHEVAASPDGRTAYVPIYGNSGVGQPGTDGRNVVVIDIASRRAIGTIDFGHGVRPHCAVFGPKDGLLYVTTEVDNTISVIDPNTLKVVGTIPTGQAESHMLALSPDGTRGYTSNVGPGTVSVIDMESRKATTVIPISAEIQRIAVSVDGRMVFTSDQTKPQLAVIDAASNKVKTWIPLPAPGYGIAPTPDGHFLVVAVRTANKVAVVDLSSMQVVHVIDVPAAPQEILVRPDGRTAYASCDASHEIAVIRTSDWTVDKLIDAGPGADGLAWAGRK